MVGEFVIGQLMAFFKNRISELSESTPPGLSELSDNCQNQGKSTCRSAGESE